MPILAVNSCDAHSREIPYQIHFNIHRAESEFGFIFTMAVSSSLPVINLQEPDRAYQARRVVDILGGLGFLMLENIPDFEESDLQWCVNFFFEVMPPEKKIQVARRLYNSKSEKVCLTIAN